MISGLLSILPIIVTASGRAENAPSTSLVYPIQNTSNPNNYLKISPEIVARVAVNDYLMYLDPGQVDSGG